jgi:predicted helicase
MPSPVLVKPTHKGIKQYYATLKGYQDDNVTHEGALETTFQRLLEETAKSHAWKLNLKRELPRIPFGPDLRAFASAGEELARLHLD